MRAHVARTSGSGAGARRRAWLLALAVHAALGCATALAAAVGDDFDDNTRDPDKWGADAGTGRGLLAEVNQHLEYTCTVPSAEDFVVRPWALTRMPYSADWEMQVDLVNTTTPTESFQVNSFGLKITSPLTGEHYVDVELYNSAFGGGGGRTGFFAALKTDGTVGTVDQAGGSGVTHGAVRMAFVSATKVVSVFYDLDSGDGYQWVAFGSFGLAGAGGTDGNTNWGLGESDQFPVYLYGYSELMPIAGNRMYADNFLESGGVTPTGGPAPDPIGNFSFGFPTTNPLLIAIFNLTGSYWGRAPHTNNRNFAIDAAQDESGKLVLMGTMDGLADEDGNPNITGGTGAVSTLNGKPTAQIKAGLSNGTLDGVSTSISGAGAGPVEVTDVGAGGLGFAGLGSLKSTVGGVPVALKNEPLAVPAAPENLENLQNAWTLDLDLRRTIVKGKKVTVAAARLTLPGGDTIEFAERVVKYSAKKGYSLSFKQGTNTTANPPRMDKKSAIAIKGLTFAPQAGGWEPTGGSVTYQFLGQKGSANLLDFVRR